jgi:hypothetical protein
MYLDVIMVIHLCIGIYADYVVESAIEENLFDELMSNPNKFISSICRFPVSNEILQPFFL